MIGTREELIEYLQEQKDGMFEVKRKREKSIRSLAMNNYWWAVPVTIIADYMGENEIKAHMALKTMFKLETTTDLSNDEFIFLMKATLELFNSPEYNLRIPLPSNSSENESLIKSLGF